MNIIKAWSYQCADHLTKQLEQNHDKRRIYYYSMQIVIGGIAKAAFLLLASILLDTLVPTVVTVIFFASLRIIAGGYHMDTYGRCFITSMLIFLIAGVAVKYSYLLFDARNIIILIAITFLTAIYAIVKWIPQDTPNKPITNPKKIMLFKKLSVIHILAWLAVCLLLVRNNMITYTAAGCIGVLLAVFIVSPAGYRFFDRINGK